MSVHTRTHTTVTFANPHLHCDECGLPVTGWHDPHQCGCASATANRPCGHAAGATSVCPSWSPIDECACPADHPHRQES